MANSRDRAMRDLEIRRVKHDPIDFDLQAAELKLKVLDQARQMAPEHSTTQQVIAIAAEINEWIGKDGSEPA